MWPRMKDCKILFLCLSVIQLYILVFLCGVDGKSRRNHKDNDRRVGRRTMARTSKTGSSKAGSLEIEEKCSSHSDCNSGFCCPIEYYPATVSFKVCYRKACCADTNSCKPADPRYTTFSFKKHKYKLFIRNMLHWVQASVKCCEWQEGGQLAVMYDDDHYNFISKEVLNSMETSQNNQEADSFLELSVYFDGTDIDHFGNYTNVFAQELDETQFDTKYFGTSQPKVETRPSCVAMRYYDKSLGNYKMVAMDCQRSQPFLCQAPY